MHTVWGDLVASWRAGETVGLATVAATRGSSPREVGAAMLVRADGSVLGSVSGGCVESAVYELAREVVESGRPVLETYGVSDEGAFAVGLTCGGDVDVFVEPVAPVSFPGLGRVAELVDAAEPVSVATVIAHPDPDRVGRRLVVTATHVVGSLGSPRADDAVRDDVRGLLAVGRSTTLTFGPDGERRGAGMRVLVISHAPPPRLIVFGAVDFAAALATMGSFLGYEVTVCDARPVFTTPERFPAAAAVVVDRPHRYLAAEAAAGRVDARTAIAVLTHDPQYDVPVLEVALRLPAVGFVGAMGSRRTHDDRMARLRAAGVTADELVGLSSPIGLDLGARTPEETALSIAGEMVAARWGGSGTPLTTLSTPVHAVR